MSTPLKGPPFVFTNLNMARGMSVVLKVEAVLILIGGIVGAFLYRSGAPPVHSLSTAYLIAACSIAVASLLLAIGFGIAALCEMHQRMIEPPTHPL